MIFKIGFKQSPKNLIAEVKKAVRKNKRNIEIPTPFGKISGAYNIDGQKVNIEILKKPFILTEKRIKKELLKLL